MNFERLLERDTELQKEERWGKMYQNLVSCTDGLTEREFQVI